MKSKHTENNNNEKKGTSSAIIEMRAELLVGIWARFAIDLEHITHHNQSKSSTTKKRIKQLADLANLK